jgi:alkanesulfonate monooxygenase SsuD/methylene tetrahydromethanopterin reductase-like flavin-dependent oxidoreductase (luciferase family)
MHLLRMQRKRHYRPIGTYDIARLRRCSPRHNIVGSTAESGGEHPMARAMPALSLVAVPGRRRATLDVAAEAERQGFAALYTPSIFGNLSLCEALCHVTERIPFATSVTPIYSRTVTDFAQSAAFIHEVSGGRFRLGVGVSHAPSHARMGVTAGRPLTDVRNFVTRFRSERANGPLPPVILATLRRKMIALAGEIADGMVFANVALSHMPASLAALPASKLRDESFFIGNMIPTCISDDLGAARAANRKSLISYAMLPNYRNHWKEAGYVAEMDAVEAAIAANRLDDIPKYLTDAWLDDCTLLGPAKRVRDRLEAWRDAGVRTPIVVPSSAAGNQMKAFEELFEAFAD